ncbi:MAG: hypothetical protein E2604_04850 [Flavobacterium sp.]|nr:hypothetical protein [Flavobacterium sp.]
MSTKLVLPILLALLFASCEVDPYEETSGKTLDVGSLSKMKAPHTCKDEEHWVEAEDGTIYWDENATSQGTTKPGETYLGATYNGLSISKYKTHTVNGVGVEIKAGYSNRSKSDSEVRWIQTIRTNDPLGGASSPYNDPQPADDSKPFYWTDTELPNYKNKEGQNLIFYDRPTRSGSQNGIKWEGELSTVINKGNEYKPAVTIRYGFETKEGVAVPLPIEINSPSSFQDKTIAAYNKTLP